MGIVVAVVFMVLTIVFQFFTFAPDSIVRIFSDLMLQFFYTIFISLQQISDFVFQSVCFCLLPQYLFCFVVSMEAYSWICVRDL